VLSAVGLNVLRLGEWLAGIPRAKTRYSPFSRLMAARPLEGRRLRQQYREYRNAA